MVVARLLLAAIASAMGACLVLAGCTREPSREDSPLDGRDASAAKRISVTFGQGACSDRAECAAKCDAGDADQCRRLGDSLLFADGGPDETRATAYYERACGLGSAPGCLSAGHMYEYHHGVGEDVAKAAAFYRRGCDEGHVPSCANFAIMLENGRGVAKDVAGAIALYREPCRAGVGLACDRLRALRALDAGGGER